MRMKRALLIRLGGLGDLLVALPSINFLRKKYPSASLTLICREEYGQILKETGVVDDVISGGQVRLSPLFAEPLCLDSNLSQWLAGFSLILGWMQQERGLKLEEFCLSLGVEKCRFFVHKADASGPISKFFFEKTAEFSSDADLPSPAFDECAFLPLTKKQKEEGIRLLGSKEAKVKKKIVIVHPGSGSESKCWSFENFLEIISKLKSKELEGALVTGEAEERLGINIKNLPLPEGWVWLHNPSLVKLAGLLQAATLYLGNDSGVTHLAAACGTRVVALFRKDLEVQWGPYGRVFLLSAHSVSQISSESVWKKISELL
jgi:ADP-heptose:LPS heptosyltransferase